MRTSARGLGGYSLLEVLVGIVIFALGMMALAQLQGNLSKSSADSNARTVAVNIAEEAIEDARRFNQLTADPDREAFANIVDDEYTLRRGGIDYAVDMAVDDYWYNPTLNSGIGGFQATRYQTNVVHPDLKQMTLTVSWGEGQEFQVDEGATAELGSGTIQLTDLISKITSPSGGKVILNATSTELFGPPVDYEPGQNPDIISIQLGDNRFKESTTPLPDVIRDEELVETAFDVVTYSQTDDGATFLRREEFRALSCECTLREPDVDSEGGLRPTLWNGFDYTAGEFVSKPFGESANNQQSVFCNVCCRDHHDGGTGQNDDGNDTGRSNYDPFKPDPQYWQPADSTSLTGDHKHYNRDSQGVLTLADGDGDSYVEACRLVRKDGFFRVAQDLRQEGLNSFPATYLDAAEEVSEYSEYVTDAVAEFESDVVDGYESSPPTLTLPINMTPPVSFPASSTATATNMSAAGTAEQQLRNRGIYIDYMSDELRTIINCLDDGGSGESCGVTGSNTALEIIPFYDVQLTWLARWTEQPNNFPIDVTNDAIQDNNAHSRGFAELTTGFGYSTINAAVNGGNLGLTGTDPIDPYYSTESYNLYALALASGTPPPTSGYNVNGSITSAVSGLKAADAEIEAVNAVCDRTNTGYECVVGTTAVSPTLKVYNYFKRNRTVVACSAQLTITGQASDPDNAAGNYTIFALPLQNLAAADILIQEGSCT